MTEIELAALVEQYTGLTDKQSPAYAQAYRLAHAVATAAQEQVAELEKRMEGYRLSSVEQWRRKKEWQGRCSDLTQRIVELESRKDLPSPAPDEPCS